ncbi:MAG: lytic murein transglycosylase [Solirubrobacterales bacterium]
MKSKLLLIVGLAVLGACVVAGTAGAGSGSVVGVGEGGVEINIPNGGNLDQVQVLPQCSNTADDDGDGITDMADPDCTGPLDASESGTSGTPTPPSSTTTTTPEQPTTTSPETTTTSPETTTPEPETGSTGPGGAVGPTGDGGRGVGGLTDSGESKPGRDRDRDRDRDGGGNNGGTRAPMNPEADRNPDGSPTDTNPSVTIADFGAAPIGVPNFVIDQFTIPPFLLPIYQACGTQYGIPWQVLASINRIETAFGTNLNVSTAGALGWMQFMPATWEMYGVDANNDGRKDPYNPVDAICAAARYLNAAGGAEDLRTAIFAYNHADWYVDEVLLYANQYGKLPETLVSSLTGLTEGAHFPVAANARYADDISERRALERSKPGKAAQLGNAAEVISSSTTRRGINIYAREGAPVVAVNDGVVTEIGKSKKLGRYLVLQDTYGNRFTYAELGEVSEAYPVPKENKLSAKDFELVTPDDEAPDRPATAGRQVDDQRSAPRSASHDEATAKPDKRERAAAAGADEESGPVNTEDARERLYAYPERRNNATRAGLTGQLDELLASRMPGYEQFKGYLANVMRFDPKKMDLRPLRKGSQVTAGTVLGRIAEPDEVASHVHFAIRPAGRGAPKIDPKPILDGWKLLEATAIYRAAGKNPFDGTANASQVLLMSKTQLIERVLNDPSIEIYACGRTDIRGGQIDRRVLAMLEYLVARGYDLTLTSLMCGHSVYTTSGNVSAHSTGDAVDIAQINGLPVLGHQGPGSVSEALVRDLLQLQGTMAPSQIISLMDYFGADNAFAMSDHADHVHVGYTPVAGPGEGSVSKQFSALLKPEQWERLIDRLGEIDNPEVPTEVSEAALPTGKGKGDKGRKRSSTAHLSE